MARALSESSRAHPDPGARGLRRTGRSELESRSRLEAPALSDDRDLAGRVGPGISAVHALLRRRQHEVLGHRAVPPPPLRTSERPNISTAPRRPGRSTTRRSSRSTTAPNACTTSAGQAGRRSHGGPARPVSARAGRPRAGGGGHRRAVAPAGTASVAAAARAPRRLRPVQHVQLVSVQDSREERRRGVRRATGDRTAERDAVDQRPGAASDHRRVRARRSTRLRWNGTARRGAWPRRSWSCRCGAVNSAALLLRSASDATPARPREFVGTRRARATWRIWPP